MTIVIREGAPDFLRRAVLPSLARESQRGLSAPAHEVIVVGSSSGPPNFWCETSALGVPVSWFAAESSERWLEIGAANAKGEVLCIVNEPGIASPTLVASLCAVFDLHVSPWVAIASLELPIAPDAGLEHWLSEDGSPAIDPFALMRRANPERDWLDPLGIPTTLAASRSAVVRALARTEEDQRPKSDLRRLWQAREGTVVKLVGDAFIRPGAAPAPVSPPERKTVEASLTYAGFVVEPGAEVAATGARHVRRERPRLSVIVIVHDMQREAPRAVRSLLPPYQRGIQLEEFEVIVVENGSSARLNEAEIRRLAPNVRYHFLADPPPSPAYAINYGVEQAGGDLLGIMIDGACLLSPGVLSAGLMAARAFSSPVVATRYFVLGPGIQRQTMLEGYDAAEEDRMLAGIDWPNDGYRLFEIASPLTFGGSSEHWLTAWFESNCLFVPRSTFEKVGGCDERFDLPGGGALNLDLFRTCCELPESQPVQLIGEGTFHQIHGGITSNTPQQDAEAKGQLYADQYTELRGRPPGRPAKGFFFLGSLMTSAARWKMRG